MTANEKTGIGKYVCYISYLTSRDFPGLASLELPFSSTTFFFLTINIHIKKLFGLFLPYFGRMVTFFQIWVWRLFTRFICIVFHEIFYCDIFTFYMYDDVILEFRFFVGSKHTCDFKNKSFTSTQVGLLFTRFSVLTFLTAAWWFNFGCFMLAQKTKLFSWIFFAFP